MSLKIWLPLNGDLTNQGIFYTTITNTGVTYNDNGKIGKCGYFNGSSYLTGTMDYTGFTEFSLAFWFKVTAAPSTWAIICNWGKANGYANEFFNAVLNGTNLYLVTANGSSYVSDFKTSYTVGEWHHFVGTYQNRCLQIYLDGVLKTSKTNITFDPSPNGSKVFGVGAAPNGAEKYTGYVNDIRMYDHCLSASEIHELSLGLIVHYKLDRIGQNGNNLVTGLTAGGRTTVTDNNTVTTAGVNSDTYFTINLSENIVVGQRYTLSCSASNVASGYKWRFPIGAQANTSLPFFIDNGYNEYTFVANDISWGNNRIFMDDSNTNNNVRLTQAVFTDFRLYKTDTIIDASGYEHNGAIVGAIAESTDAARYNGSLSFDGSSYITHPYALSELAAEQEWTCCAWVKPSAVASYTYLNNFNMGNRLNHGGRPILYLNSGTNDYYMYGSTGYPILNEWQHFAFVFRNSDGYRKIYVDGVDISASGPSKTSTPSGILKTIEIGVGLTGLLSDYREYATALTADDVKKLYDLGMKVDDAQDMHGLEYEETVENLLRTEVIQPYAKSGSTAGIGEWVLRNGVYAMDIRPAPFYNNITVDGTVKSAVLRNELEPNTQYVLDLWIDADDVKNNGTNVSAGLQVVYTDNTSSNVCVTGGNKGFQHKLFITDVSKSVDRITSYYYVSSPTYYRYDSYIAKVTNDTGILRTGIDRSGKFIEGADNLAKINKDGAIHAKEFIEL